MISNSISIFLCNVCRRNFYHKIIYETRFVIYGCKIWRVLRYIYCQIVCNFFNQSVAAIFSLLPNYENVTFREKKCRFGWRKKMSVSKDKSHDFDLSQFLWKITIFLNLIWRTCIVTALTFVGGVVRYIHCRL